jgi:hypothetical protein
MVGEHDASLEMELVGQCQIAHDLLKISVVSSGTSSVYTTRRLIEV